MAHDSSVLRMPSRFSSTLISILFFFLIFPCISYLLHFLPHFFHFLEGRSEPVHSAKKGMDSLDDSYSLTGYEPNAFDLKETYVESYTESLTPRSSPSKGFPRTSSTMTREAHRVHLYHSQREGLSVGQSSSVSESTGRPVGERTERPVESIGQELNVANAQIRTLLDSQKERILDECQAGIKKHEFQADYDRRSVRKFCQMIESQQEELHCAQELIISLNEMEELKVSEFHLRHYCKTKIS